MFNNFIINYIRKMNFESAKIFALNFGITFSDEEIRIILPYLQQNAPYLLTLRNMYKKIHIDLDDKVSVNAVDRLCLLFKKLGYR